WHTSAPPSDSDLLAGRAESSMPGDGGEGRVVEVRLRRGIRVRGRFVVPSEAAGLPVHVDVQQGNSRRQGTTIAAGQPTFTMLLDPDYGVLGSVSARAGPDDAPRFTARVAPAHFGEGEIVLALEPVK